MDKRIPMRTCIGCREIKPKQELIRIVKPASGPVTVDETGRLDGRGAYLCRDRECFEKAVARKSFARTYKAAIPEEEINGLREFFETL